ncbi:hypothetical protein KAFR_0E01530 [Kazachstania africana CBS 2517]|uniref:DUF155 domain-containing protein n=1 Tax=Kazachstania africana (strain ATCC 22294 / BCRC 22015 / CBS 2517 / CECT 1963 / NBRC 1671 / NRRL Y-8276) TaxID=1071382 RepID=H2AVA7_KAZAF|nr:hypothetical protein KAFR_0E01530 [Kazachstania africana CBS 2517]CCF58307.1 hypothetical protein KAFR_0E01530 [Kazachstania africana CBS 2517]
MFLRPQFILRSLTRNLGSTAVLGVAQKNFKISNSSAISSSKYLRRSIVKQPQIKELTNKLVENFKVSSCTSVTTSERYDLDKCYDILVKKNFKITKLIPNEVLLLEFEKGTVFIMGSDGATVSWGIEENVLRSEIIPLIENACINPLSENEFEIEDMDYIELRKSEDLSFVQDICDREDDNSFLLGDLIMINSVGPLYGVMDKVAFSSGLSRSTMLAVLENKMETHIKETRKVTEKISKGVTNTKMKEKDVLRFIGRLFMIRGQLNLYSELIETPDLYWSETQLEEIFKKISNYLDMKPRISILNSKLDYSTEECRLLISLLNERKSSFLEWIIIYLIAFELFFELYHYYERKKYEKDYVNIN